MAAKEMNVKRVIFASSSAIYDEKYDLPHEEEKNILPYSSPYALTKYIGELYLNLYNQIYGLETVCFRYFNVYGPRQDPKGEYAAVIPKFITEILNGETPTIYGDGMQTRDFIYVKDVVRANLLACQQDNISGEVFNIGQGNNTSLEILLKKIKNIVKSDVSHKYDEARPGDVRYSIADISKSKSILGLEPSFDLERGLKLVIKWFKRDLTSNIGKY
jgi:nucleoside-diphosphate-sugar epimerase